MKFSAKGQPEKAATVKKENQKKILMISPGARKKRITHGAFIQTRNSTEPGRAYLFQH